MNPKSETEAVAKYRPFVLKMAKRFARSGAPFEDLMQEGLIAVAVAFRVWDPKGGANFLTWIHRPVRFAMLKVAREHRRQGGSFRGAGKGAMESFRLVSMDSDNGNVPKLSGGLRSVRDVTNISPSMKKGGYISSLHDLIGSFEEPSDPFVRGRLPDLVRLLSERERQVIRLRFVRGLTHSEVGARLKISRELARQLEKRALARLKELMKSGEEAVS